MRATDLEVPDAFTHPAEATVGLVLEVSGQIPGLAEGHVHALVEVLAGLAVAFDDLVGDEFVQERPEVVPERFVFLRQHNAGEIHPGQGGTPALSCKAGSVTELCS